MKTEFHQDLFKLIYSKTNYSQLILEQLFQSRKKPNWVPINVLVVGRYYFNYHFSFLLF